MHSRWSSSVYALSADTDSTSTAYTSCCSCVKGCVCVQTRCAGKITAQRYGRAAPRVMRLSILYEHCLAKQLTHTIHKMRFDELGSWRGIAELRVPLGGDCCALRHPRPPPSPNTKPSCHPHATNHQSHADQPQKKPALLPNRRTRDLQGGTRPGTPNSDRLKPNHPIRTSSTPAQREQVRICDRPLTPTAATAAGAPRPPARPQAGRPLGSARRRCSYVVRTGTACSAPAHTADLEAVHEGPRHARLPPGGALAAVCGRRSGIPLLVRGGRPAAAAAAGPLVHSVHSSGERGRRRAAGGYPCGGVPSPARAPTPAPAPAAAHQCDNARLVYRQQPSGQVEGDEEERPNLQAQLKGPW